MTVIALARVPTKEFAGAVELAPTAVQVEAANEQAKPVAVIETDVVERPTGLQQQPQHYTAEHIRQMRSQMSCRL